jgi:hypothetical protein
MLPWNAIMNLPSFFVGTYEAVERECRARAKKLARGTAWGEVIGEGRVDTREFEGAIVLSGVRPPLPGVHAHVYAFDEAVFRLPRDARPRDLMDGVFDAVLSDTATVPILLGVHARLLFAERGVRPQVTPEVIATRHVPFLRALLRDWDALWSVGPRYTNGLPPKLLTDLPTTIQFVLSHCGIDPQHVNARLTNEGFPALAREVLDRYNQ